LLLGVDRVPESLLCGHAGRVTMEKAMVMCGTVPHRYRSCKPTPRYVRLWWSGAF
jgi:hypothetical protein